MALAHDAPKDRSRLAHALTTDFCPWANRFVYWLKEPIGWFVLATMASAMVGAYANPMGWTIAGALSAVMLVGMVWPLIAIWATRCDLHPEVNAVHEGTSCRMIFSVRNRIPVPLWGLAVEGYLDCEGDESSPVVALSHVPPICVADYAIAIRPTLRGHYPIQTPKIACSFPFGIWTARRELRSIKPLTVWPYVYEISGVCPLDGRVNTEVGEGQRGGRSGDFVGVRGFRRGDSPRHINWAKSAQKDSLIVTERGGPQCVELDLLVDPTLAPGQSRQSLAIRIRVAASILCSLHDLRVPMNVSIGESLVRHGFGSVGRRQLLNALANVPADGHPAIGSPRVRMGKMRIEVTGGVSGDHADVVVKVTDPNASSRDVGKQRRIVIGSKPSLDEQMVRFWEELGYAPIAA